MTTTTKFGVIDRTALKSKLDAKEKMRLWNVLSKEYFKPEKNIPGSLWIPVDKLSESLKSLNVGKDEEIVVYCGGWRCPSSKQAAEKLSYLGYSKVWAYEGGLEDWIEGGLPLEKIAA